MANKKASSTETEKFDFSNEIEEMKKEVLKYTEDKIDMEVEYAIKKAEKKLINSKNFSIIKRDIIIILLLILTVFLTYSLYENGYFDKYFEDETDVVNKNSDNTSDITSNESEEKDSLSKLIEEYSYLLDNITISETSNYLKDYYTGNITSELKLYLSMQNLDEEKITVDEDTTIINEEDLIESYRKLFDTSNYEPTSFTYNGSDLKYLKSQKLYISTSKLEKEKSNIKKVIYDIEINDNDIEIYTVEAVIQDNKMYNVATMKSAGKYADDDSILESENKLTKVKYTFTKTDSNTLLSGIEAE